MKWVALMRSRSAANLALVVLIAALQSCTIVPTGPLGPGELRMLKMEPPKTIRAGSPYEVVLTFEADGTPEITRACFLWSWEAQREGPYCFPVYDVKPGHPGTLKVSLYTRYPRVYTLDGYAEYQRGEKLKKSNEVSVQIWIER